MAEWNPSDISTVVGAARTTASSLGARFRSRVANSTFVGYLSDFILNTNADVYQIRQDVDAIRRKLGA